MLTLTRTLDDNTLLIGDNIKVFISAIGANHLRDPKNQRETIKSFPDKFSRVKTLLFIAIFQVLRIRTGEHSSTTNSS